MCSVKFCRSALDHFCSQITWIYAFNEDIGGSVPRLRPILLKRTFEPFQQTAIRFNLVIDKILSKRTVRLI